MQKVGARTINDFILDYRGQRAVSGGDVVQAANLNTPIIVAETQADLRYRAPQNRSVPKKIDSHLVTFDCITCDKCIPVCPNDANFAYHTGELRLTYCDVEVRPDGSIIPVGDEREFKIEKADQIANFADYCNHCGNCDTFCPEYDGPYLKKPNFYGSRPAFEAGAPHDGFFVECLADRVALIGRIENVLYRYEDLANGSGARYTDGVVTISIGSSGQYQLAPDMLPPAVSHTIDVGRLHAVATLLRGITDSTRVHAVNVPLLAAVAGKTI
jgi:putative selenate reductase